MFGPIKKSIIFFVVILMAISYVNDWAVFAQEETEQEEQEIGGSTEPQTDDEKIKEYERQIEESQKLQEEYRRQAEELAINLQQAQGEANTLSAQIARFNGDVASLQSKINIKQEEIRSTQLAIQKINIEIEKKEKEIASKKGQMIAAIQEINKNDSETTVELILKYESFSSFFNQVQAREVLQEIIDKDLQELKILKEELVGANGTLETKKTELEGEQGILRNQRIILENRRYNHQLLLNQTKEEESEYQELLANLRQKELEINREIFELEDRLRRTLDPSALPQAYPGALQWPTKAVPYAGWGRGRPYISQPYGCISSWNTAYLSGGCPDGYSFHNGLDIAEGFGAPLLAAEDGEVIYIYRTPQAYINSFYGNWVAVSHPNGLVTVYPHISSQIPVSVGQTVTRGTTVVGYMDSTGYSTGAHVHFMVFPSTGLGAFIVQPSSNSNYSGLLLPTGYSLDPINYLSPPR